MEQVTIQFQADRSLVEETSEICEELGFDLTTALKMFLSKVKFSKGIPFEMKLNQNHISHRQALETFYKMREEVADLPEMTLDEINAEIAEARADIKARRKRNAQSSC